MPGELALQAESVGHPQPAVLGGLGPSWAPADMRAGALSSATRTCFSGTPSPCARANVYAKGRSQLSRWSCTEHTAPKHSSVPSCAWRGFTCGRATLRSPRHATTTRSSRPALSRTRPTPPAIHHCTTLLGAIVPEQSAQYSEPAPIPMHATSAALLLSTSPSAIGSARRAAPSAAPSSAPGKISIHARPAPEPAGTLLPGLSRQPPGHRSPVHAAHGHSRHLRLRRLSNVWRASVPTTLHDGTTGQRA